MSLETAKRKRDYLFVQLLQAFSKSELEGFTHFTACRYFNTDKFAVKLLDTLLKNSINTVEFTPALQVKAYIEVFTDKEKPKNQLTAKQKSFLAAKMNVLLDLAKTFLCNEALKTNTACKNELILNSLIEKNQVQLFKRILTKEKKKLEVKKCKDFEDYENAYKIESAQLNYLNQANLLLKEDNLEELNYKIDIFYILNKLDINSVSISLSKLTTDRSGDLNVIPILKDLLNLKKYTKHPLILLYMLSNELQTKNCEQVYQKLMLHIDKYDQFLSINALEGFYIVASNFCSYQIKKGERKYYREMFTIYQKRDEKNLLVINNNINIGTLKNLVTLSCRVDAFAWATQMIEKYISFVKKELKDSVYHFNIGTIAFYENDFNRALHHFIRVDNVNLVYNINCKMMILKTHYLLDKEYDERAIRIFLMAERYIKNQKKLGASHKKAYKNFVRILINIYKYKHHANKMKKENIITKLEKMDYISDKKWLLQMIENLPER